MGALGVTRRGVVGSAVASTLIGAGGASAQGVGPSLINNVLVVGYNYKQKDNVTGGKYEDVALSDAAIHVANAFMKIQTLNERRGRPSETRVTLECNAKGDLLPVEGVKRPPTRGTIEKFCESDFTDENVILYFIGHGVVDADEGIQLVRPDGTRIPVWSLLRSFEQKAAARKKKTAARVVIIDCCRVQGSPVAAEHVSHKGEEAAFIFSAPPKMAATADKTFKGTTFTTVFLEHLGDQVELSTLFLQVRQDPAIAEARTVTNVEPILYTSLSRPVWLAGAPNPFGDGKSWPLFFPG